MPTLLLTRSAASALPDEWHGPHDDTPPKRKAKSNERSSPRRKAKSNDRSFEPPPFDSGRPSVHMPPSWADMNDKSLTHHKSSVAPMFQRHYETGGHNQPAFSVASEHSDFRRTQGFYYEELEDAGEPSTQRRLTKEQAEVLERQFQENHKPTSMQRRQLAMQTMLSLPRVANWFQNRRAKAKERKKEEEYMYGYKSSHARKYASNDAPTTSTSLANRSRYIPEDARSECGRLPSLELQCTTRRYPHTVAGDDDQGSPSQNDLSFARSAYPTGLSPAQPDLLSDLAGLVQPPPAWAPMPSDYLARKSFSRHYEQTQSPYREFVRHCYYQIEGSDDNLKLVIDEDDQKPSDSASWKGLPHYNDDAHQASGALPNHTHTGDIVLESSKIDAAQYTEIELPKTHDYSDGEISFVGAKLGVNDHRMFDERAERWTQDFVLHLARRIVVICLRHDKKPWSSCACCVCLEAVRESVQTVPVGQAHGSGSREHGRGSDTVALCTQMSEPASARSSARKRRLSQDDEEDSRKQKKKPPNPGNSGPSPVSEVTTLLACPYYKHDPLRYSSHNVREKEYRGCASSFLRDIPRLKQHLYRVHKRPNFCCSRCSGLFDTQELLNEHSRQDPPCQVCQPLYQEKMNTSQYLTIKRRQVGSDMRKQWYHIFRVLFPSAPEPDSPYAEAASAATFSNEVQHFANLFRYFGPDIVRQMLSDRQQLVQRGEFAPLEISTFELVEETFHVAFPLYQQAGGEDRDASMDQRTQSQPPQAESSATAIDRDNAARSSMQSLVQPGSSMDEDRRFTHLGAEVTPPEEWLAFDDYLQFTSDAMDAFTNFDPFAMLGHHDGEV